MEDNHGSRAVRFLLFWVLSLTVFPCSETTGSTLEFILFELAQHHNFQDKLRAEIQAAELVIFARGDTTFRVTDLENLAYCSAVIKVCTSSGLGRET